MKQTKAVVVRKAVVGYPAIAERKVAGEVYIPGVDAVPSDPGEVQVTMTVEEAQKVACILGQGVCSLGNVSIPYDVYAALLGAVGYGLFSWQPALGVGGYGYLTTES